MLVCKHSEMGTTVRWLLFPTTEVQIDLLCILVLGGNHTVKNDGKICWGSIHAPYIYRSRSAMAYQHWANTVYRISSKTSSLNNCCLPHNLKLLNKRHPQIVAAASKCGMCTRVQMISGDGHHTSTRTVCVVQVVPTADSRTERMRVLLTVSSKPSLSHLYVPYPAIVDVSGLSKK